MTEEIKTQITFTELSQFIETHLRKETSLEKQISTDTENVEISIKKLITILTEVQDEIESNHRIALKSWRQSHKIYGDFIKKNPGSTLIKLPDRMPSKTTQLQTIKSYIRLYKTLNTDVLKTKISTLKEIFQISSKALEESYATRDTWVGNTTGSMMMANYVSSGTSLNL